MILSITKPIEKIIPHLDLQSYITSNSHIRTLRFKCLTYVDYVHG